jgi:hypothetical protein
MLKIRIAASDDAEGISGIHVDCWSECYRFIPQSVHAQRSLDHRLSQWRLALAAERIAIEPIVVVESAGEIVGFAIMKANTDQWMPEAAFELHAMYIRKEFRGGLAAPLMLQMLLDLVQGRPADRFAVWVFRENPMRYAYLASGMRIKVRRSRDICGEQIPELGLLSPEFALVNQRLEGVISRIAARVDASQNQPRSKDRFALISERIGKSR